MRPIPLFLVLVSVLTLAPVAAQDGPVTIEFYYPTATDNPAADIFARYAEDFNAANPDVQVVPVYAGGYDDITAAARNSIENEGVPGPDVAVLLAVDLFFFIDNDYIVPAQDFIPAENGQSYLDDFFPAFMENSVDGDGNVWTIPFQRSTPILFYNRDLFREVRLDPDQPPRNREELLDYAAQLTDLDEDRYGLYVPSAGFPYWLFQSFAIAHGQNVVEASPAEVYFNTPEVVDALDYFVSLSAEGVMSPGALSFFDADEAFIEEQAAMIYYTTGGLRDVIDRADFEVGVGFLPSGPADEDGTGYGAPTGGGNLYIFSNTTPEEQEAAWRWVEYLTSPEIQADWTVNTGYIAARQSAWETDTLLDLVDDAPEFAVARDQLAYARKELTTHEGIEVRALLNSALAAVIAGEAETAAALDEAQVAAEILLEPYR